MTDGEIRSRIKRQQSDVPHLMIRRVEASEFSIATPPPFIGTFAIVIPLLRGHFHVTEMTSAPGNKELDLD